MRTRALDTKRPSCIHFALVFFMSSNHAVRCATLASCAPAACVHGRTREESARQELLDRLRPVPTHSHHRFDEAPGVRRPQVSPTSVEELVRRYNVLVRTIPPEYLKGQTFYDRKGVPTMPMHGHVSAQEKRSMFSVLGGKAYPHTSTTPVFYPKSEAETHKGKIETLEKEIKKLKIENEKLKKIGKTRRTYNLRKLRQRTSPYTCK